MYRSVAWNAIVGAIPGGLVGAVAFTIASWLAGTWQRPVVLAVFVIVAAVVDGWYAWRLRVREDADGDLRIVGPIRVTTVRRSEIIGSERARVFNGQHCLTLLLAAGTSVKVSAVPFDHRSAIIGRSTLPTS